MEATVTAKEAQRAPQPPAGGDSAAGDRGRGGDAPAFSGRELAVLLAITLVAAGLRLLRLGEWSFWVDEAHTYRDATVGLDQFWDSHVHRYPLAYLMLRGLLSVLPSISEGWLRLPFVFFGIAAVPALALVGRPIVGRVPALLAAAFLAVSPWHLYWSQSCRSYAIVLFLCVLALGAFWQGVHRGSVRWFLAAVALAVVGGLCHMSAYLVLAVFVVFGLLERRLSTGSRKADAARSPAQRLWPWLVLAVMVALIPALLGGLAYIRRAKPETSFLHLVQTTTFFVRLPLGVLALAGFCWLFGRRERSALFLVCWILAPLLLLSIVGAFVAKVTAQYAVYILPAFCLLAGAAAHAFGTQAAAVGNRLARVGVAVVPALIPLLDMLGYDYLYFAHQHGDRPDWRAAKDVIEREPGRPRLVLTTNGPSMRYYLEPDTFARPGDSTLVVPMLHWHWRDHGPRAYLEKYVDDARQRDLDLWVVLTEPELHEMAGGRELDQEIRRRLLQLARFPVWTGPKDMTVLVYRLPDEATRERGR